MPGDPIVDPFNPIQLRGLHLKNRFIKSATYEGMCRDGQPTEQLIDFHTQIAKGGVAMTTVAYGAVNSIGRTHGDQMFIREELLPSLKKLTASVHHYHCAASIQLTHCGFFTKYKVSRAHKPLAPSRQLNLYGLMDGIFYSKSMSGDEIEQTAKDFAQSARISRTAGFDAVEIHMGHGYLISQFLSPGINKRRDRYGGPLKNRMRFPIMVLEKVREAVGQNFPIFCKINLEDGFHGGLTIEDSVKVARSLENAGADGLILSGGYTSKTPFYLMRGEIPLKQMIRAERKFLQKIGMTVFGRFVIKKYPFEENFFLPLAIKIRRAVNLPLVYLGGVLSGEGISRIMNEGFDLIALGRVLIHDPDFIKKIDQNPEHQSACNQCNQCVAEMDRSGVRCVIN
jgi:2,4-dienoyl-CoA reductase-like NADH-dependent reductase (Old Yellow Enzyme family)